MTPNQRFNFDRLQKCRKEGLCFISLEPLDVNDKNVDFWPLQAWLERVAVKARFAPKHDPWAWRD